MLDTTNIGNGVFTDAITVKEFSKQYTLWPFQVESSHFIPAALAL